MVRRIGMVLVLASAPLPLAAQTLPRATVVTTANETLEGAFRGATSTDLLLEIAGQQLKVPIASIAYVSFTGRRLVDGRGKKLEGDLGTSMHSTIERRVPPGRYAIWAGTWKQNEVGSYTLRVSSGE